MHPSTMLEWLPVALVSLDAPEGDLPHAVARRPSDRASVAGGDRGLSAFNCEACVHDVVGNSTFHGVSVPTGQRDAAMPRRAGIAGVTVRRVRMRYAKKALVEFDVCALWPGRA